MRLVASTTIATTLLVLTACGTDSERSRSDPSRPPTSDSTTTQNAAPLEWQPTGHDPDQRVIVGELWTAVVTETEVVFEGEERVVVPAEQGGSVDAVLLAGDTAVVSTSFGGEASAGWGVLVDLSTGTQTRIVSPEPTNGGGWAMAEGDLYYPTLGEGGSYCLATMAIADTNGEDGWCAPARTGFANLNASEHGVGLMTFDDRRPIACRTAHLLDQASQPRAVAGPAECKVWDVAATDNGVIFSEVPKAQRQEVARFRATTGSLDGPVQDLGPGTTGTLIPCGGDTFFARDPQRRSDPATLMRWDGSDLSVAFESTSTGDAFLGAPECADGIVTLNVFGEGGDEQVSASVS